MWLQFLDESSINFNKWLFGFWIEVQNNFLQDHFIWLTGLIEFQVIVLKINRLHNNYLICKYLTYHFKIRNYSQKIIKLCRTLTNFCLSAILAILSFSSLAAFLVASSS